MKRCLVIELWGLGDATLMTAALQGLLNDGWEITVLVKPSSCTLLRSTYPSVDYLEFNAPWTAFRGKYRLWRWPWNKIFNLLGQLRQARFTAALSVRKDPRDHLLMWLATVPRRIGFLAPWSRWFLNELLPVNDEFHRVEDWWRLQRQVTPSAQITFSPHLIADASLAKKFHSQFGNTKPTFVLHTGARIGVRRWPEIYFRELILRLRQEFDFQLVLIPDPDGYGASLQDLADHTLRDLSIAELVAALSCANQVICNDSAPSHLTAALGIPVITFFGPQESKWFRPFGQNHLVIIRDLCPYRPCSDYCRFPEAYCLTKLTPDMVWPEIKDYIQQQKRFPLLER